VLERALLVAILRPVSLSVVQHLELLSGESLIELPEKEVETRIGDAGRLTQASICGLLLENRVAARKHGHLRIAASGRNGKKQRGKDQ
jgi:hypothetical protein